MNDTRMKRVDFATKRLYDAFNQLKLGKFEDKELASNVDIALDKLKYNPSCGVTIPRKLWPREYVREFGINNLWKYNLPNGWRLIYFLRGSKVEVVSIILEWFDHAQYERRFGYKKG
ncbi:MAG: hypothetical protein KGH49_02345 [Candidatus Micrarchaeota archaeon]|nr:hypothetical protein [Candidatus Micrarchaeota archaeon]